MGLDGWLLLIGLFLILIDIFFSSDYPTFLSFILFTVVICRQLSGWHIMLRLSAGIVIFFLFVFLYYFVWMKFKKHFVDTWFAKDIMRNGIDALVGEMGTVRIIDGVYAAKIHGDLYPFHEPVQQQDGTPFIVKDIKGGTIVPEFLLSERAGTK